MPESPTTRFSGRQRAVKATGDNALPPPDEPSKPIAWPAHTDPAKHVNVRGAKRGKVRNNMSSRGGYGTSNKAGKSTKKKREQVKLPPYQQLLNEQYRET